MSSARTTATSAATSLRAVQAPLKERYRNNPSSALITFRKSGTLDPTNLTCSLQSPSTSKRIAGLHAAAGGSVSAPDLCSGDILLESLVACFGVTVRAVATALGITLRSGTVTAEGDLDFRGTMGIKTPSNEYVPVGFQAIHLDMQLELEDEDDANKVEKLIELSQRYCVVLQTLNKGVEVVVENVQESKANPDEKGGHWN